MYEQKYIIYFIALIIFGAIIAIGGFFLPAKIRIRTVLLGILSLFVGVFLTSLSLFVSELRISLDSKDWQVVNGEIIRSKILNKYHPPGLPRSQRSGGKEFKVLYEFVVDNETYEGHRLSLGGYGGDSEYWKELEGKYSPSSEVRVYYNPEDPTESVLIKNPSYGWIFLVLSVIFCYLSFRTVKAFFSKTPVK